MKVKDISKVYCTDSNARIYLQSEKYGSFAEFETLDNLANSYVEAIVKKLEVIDNSLTIYIE